MDRGDGFGLRPDDKAAVRQQLQMMEQQQKERYQSHVDGNRRIMEQKERMQQEAMDRQAKALAANKVMSSGLPADMRAGFSAMSTKDDENVKADDLRRSRVDKPAIFGVLMDEAPEPKVQPI